MSCGEHLLWGLADAGWQGGWAATRTIELESSSFLVLVIPLVLAGML